MNLFELYHAKILTVLTRLITEGVLPEGIDLSRINCENPRDDRFGDMATNAAMILAKPAGQQPLLLAQTIADELAKDPDIESAHVVAPGFINLRLPARVWQDHLTCILEHKDHYGDCQLGKNQWVNVEYVSTNPTGPMHAGHARVAVVGDIMANLLQKAGYQVEREYYINDAGGQIDVLAQSVYLRYREALGQEIGAIPEGLYPGDYLIPVAQHIVALDGDKWLNAPQEEWLESFRIYATDAMMDLIREDLKILGVTHDIFYSEKAMIKAGKVDAAIAALEAKDLVYTGTLEQPKGVVDEDWEPREQLLFRSTTFGDDMDRALKKSDGSWTYFASDIAYHKEKFDRHQSQLVNVWGADHIGHIKRTTAAVKAITDGKAEIDVMICQLVNLLDKGEAVRMSKRAGNFVTLRQVVETVGRDVVRFMMLTRKNDMTLDFDFAKVTEFSKDNPVFYVNYAHARICSVFRQLTEAAPPASEADFSLLTHEQELRLMRQMALWPKTVDVAARLHEPHKIAFYLYELASQLHILWHHGKEDASLRFICPENKPLTAARLALLQAVRYVIVSGLNVFGVTALEEMH
jgi:arginyl-tRNA synthetase